MSIFIVVFKGSIRRIVLHIFRDRKAEAFLHSHISRFGFDDGRALTALVGK